MADATPAAVLQGLATLATSTNFRDMEVSIEYNPAYADGANTYERAVLTLKNADELTLSELAEYSALTTTGWTQVLVQTKAEGWSQLVVDKKSRA